MPLNDAYGQKKKHNVMAGTWGHLYPEPGKHPAVFHVAVSEYGDSVILSADYEYVGNPLDMFMFPQVLDLISTDSAPAVYKVECELWFFKKCHDAYLGEHVGRPIKSKISLAWSN